MRGGALKRTSDGQWVHILCALFLGARFKDSINMEPINVLTIDKTAVQLKCCYCMQGDGACLRCQKCDNSFHPTCGLSSGVLYIVSESDIPNLEVNLM